MRKIIQTKILLRAYVGLALLLSLHCSKQASPSLPSTPSSSPLLTADCQKAVLFFNSSATTGVERDIRATKDRLHSLPPELIALYPAARDEWNDVLSSIKSNFSRTWELPESSYTGSPGRWRETSLSDAQKFFFLLTELRWGPYENRQNDLEGKAAWRESSDLKKRINARLRRLREECGNNAADVRQQLDLKYLPQAIEECLNP